MNKTLFVIDKIPSPQSAHFAKPSHASSVFSVSLRLHTGELAANTGKMHTTESAAIHDALGRAAKMSLITGTAWQVRIADGRTWNVNVDLSAVVLSNVQPNVLSNVQPTQPEEVSPEQDTK